MKGVGFLVRFAHCGTRPTIELVTKLELCNQTIRETPDDFLIDLFDLSD